MSDVSIARNQHFKSPSMSRLCKFINVVVDQASYDSLFATQQMFSQKTSFDQTRNVKRDGRGLCVRSRTEPNRTPRNSLLNRIAERLFS